MTVDLAVLNPPPANQASPQAYYKWSTLRMSLPAGNVEARRQIAYIPFKVNHRPTTIQFSATSSVTLEVTNAHPDHLLPESPSPIWTAVTITGAFMILDYPITAVRIQNSSASAVTVDIL